MNKANAKSYGAGGLTRLGALLFTAILLFSCTTGTPLPPPQVVSVYSTSAAQPWLTKLYDCAADSSIVPNLTAPDSAEIILRIGEPKNLTAPAYQIDVEEILIVTHRESPIRDLTLEEARALFAGQGDPSVQVWVYDSAEDVQEMFEQIVMAGRSVTSFARGASSPGQMSDLLNAEQDAVGILPKRWKSGDSRIVFNAGSVPVLAILKQEPQGALTQLLACLQD